jgi:hypothetical protein
MLPFARRFHEVAFVAETKGPGQGRGWKPAGVLRTLQEVGAEAGAEAVVQLKAVALRGFERAWLQGLLSEADVARVTAMGSLPRVVDAPRPKLAMLPLQFGQHTVETSAAEQARTLPPIHEMKPNWGRR